jgi:hypothetical protein
MHAGQACPDLALGELPQVRIRLRGNPLALRDTLDPATGEPSDVDLRAEEVLDVERDGYQPSLTRRALRSRDTAGPPRKRDDTMNTGSGGGIIVRLPGPTLTGPD